MIEVVAGSFPSARHLSASSSWRQLQLPESIKLLNDRESVQNAIRQMESTIDNKVARYRGNALVSQLVPKMKEHYRKKILEIAIRER